MHAKYQGAKAYEPKWDFIVIFWISGLRTNQNKIFKSYLQTLKQQFTMGTKNIFNWNFPVVAKAMIHFDKGRIY